VVERPQHARRRRNRRRIKWALVSLLVVVLVAGVLVGVERINRPLALPTVPAARGDALVVPGTAPALPWPAGGQAAVSIPSLGYARQSGPETPVPIASLTKMTTALVILRDHPVAPHASGPSITITADDAAQFDVDLANNETNIPLQTGETLTELQMLEALLNQSANDVAYSLAVWDAGSEAAFVAKMNAEAASLGATQTHYVDASGFDPQSVSTASDVLRIAAAGMSIPTFAEVAAMPTVTLPLVGTANNIVTEIGSDGVVGVKSGYTSQAFGCMVLAAYRMIGGRSVLVLASALGQHVPTPDPTLAATTTPTYSALEAQYPLRYTGPIVENLLDASKAAVTTMVVARRGAVLGTASVDWAGDRRRVAAVATDGATLLGVPGQRVAVRTEPPTSRTAGETTLSDGRVGSAVFTLGAQTATVLLTQLHAVKTPSWWWKLSHNW